MRIFNLNLLFILRRNLILQFPLYFLTNASLAQWSTSSSVNNPICTASNTQYNPQMVSDGNNGAIIAWSDYRGGANYDIYVQRISSAGYIQWTSNGVAVVVSTGDQDWFTMVEDGSGGAIIAWPDGRSGTYDIYAQKINSSGVVQWTSNGVIICNATNIQTSPRMCSDGSGGAIITWLDYRINGINQDIYAQSINSSGTLQWTSNGVIICNATNDQYFSGSNLLNGNIITDGSGGAIITWWDYRSGTNTDIYAQRINSGGSVNWTGNGVIINNASNNQHSPQIVSDGSSGAIILFTNDVSGTGYDIYAQRINSSGTVQWTANGIVVTSAASHQYTITAVSDGSGGAIAVWEDLRNGGTQDIYAQKINSSGTSQWSSNGIVICNATLDQYLPRVISDGSGGALFSWEDYRNGSHHDIYAQKVNSSGATQWTSNGVAVCNASTSQDHPVMISGSSNGAIMVWQDRRNGAVDIYAAYINSSGALPVKLIDFKAECINNKINLTWATVSEISNDYFTIERSEDYANFTEICRVPGNGNTSQISKYNFTDKQPLSKMAYYRLKQTDYNGQFEYFHANPVICNTSVHAIIFPNPSQGDFNVQTTQKGVYKLYNVILPNFKPKG